jgi:hypothetical protein
MGVPLVKPEFPPLFPAGFHVVALAELRQLCVKNFSGSITRRGIMDGIETVVRELSNAGIIGEFWVDGSFVTEKIDPDDADTLVHVSSEIYDNEPAKRTLIDWASHENLKATHSCDSYKWIEYSSGHPLHAKSETERKWWTDWFGTSRKGVPKGILVVSLPAVTS